MSRLVVLMDGVEAGRLDWDRGKLTLTYADTDSDIGRAPGTCRHDRMGDMAARLPDLAVQARAEIAEQGGAHPLNDRLVDVFAERSRWVSEELARS